MGLPRRRVGTGAKKRSRREKPLAKASRPAPTPASLDAALEAAWATRPVTTQAVDEVTLRCAAQGGPRPSFQVVTRGFAARGFELSFRVPVSPEGTPLPEWCAPLVRALWAQAEGVEAGQCVDVGRFAGPESELASVVLVADLPLMRAQAEPPFPVLLAVGITADEAKLVRSWSPQGLLEVLGKTDPLLLTDPARPSLLLSPRARALIEQRAQKEGSSMAVVRAATSEAKQTAGAITWRLDAGAAQTVVALLQGRLGHQRGFQVISPSLRGEVQPAEAPSVELTAQALSLKLNLPAARAMRAQLKGPGRYTWEEIPGLAIEVVET